MESVPEAWEVLDSAASSGVLKHDSDNSVSTDQPLSGRLEQGSWPDGGSLAASSGSLEDPLKVPPIRTADQEDRVRFQEPADRRISQPLSPKAEAWPADVSVPQPNTLEAMSIPSANHTSDSGNSFQPSQGTWSTTNTGSSQAGNVETSGTIVPADGRRFQEPLAVRPPTNGTNKTVVDGPKADTLELTFPLRHRGSGGREDTEADAPFSVIDLLDEVLRYHTETLLDAQTASQLLLLIAPLLPQNRPPDSAVATRTSAIYTEHLTSLGLSPDKVQQIVSTSLTSISNTGLHPLQAEAILATYHEQLMSLRLLNAAANLRRLCYPVFPAVYEQGVKETSIGLRCEGCNNPLNNPKTKARCESCSQRQAPCPICWCERPAIEPPVPKGKKQKRKKGHARASSIPAPSVIAAADSFSASAARAHDVAPVGPERSNSARDPAAAAAGAHPDPASGSAPASSPSSLPPSMTHPPTLWLTCPLCNHSAHLSCFSAWLVSTFSPGDLAEGACPTPSCTCDCAPGALRDEVS
ncbi:MAG: hypothetical protein INR71_13990, partial [Terriglobus roseus]|nr:hypothetical protein [Terriglobus roseus]